ncbi:MFS transporter [Amycolatopsis thermoflava]|uniref:MFS transporter n=1 Tax=Amycolatopsis thermoflava TaxID=84480 RepID=A0A3N2GXA0_9PSEU|nr:MFS transporter [Amycolatopsis thermoflava]ROS41278.1 MFS transporter [Amycolatopsis thermoflava]
MNRAYWRWSVGAQLYRLPIAMGPLAFTSVAAVVTGSYRLGGVMVAVLVGAEIVGAVPCGRLLDRIGVPRGLVLLLLAAGTAMAALVVAAGAESRGLLVALVVVPGLVVGGLSGGFRTLLGSVVPDERLPRAVAIDSMLFEGVLITGPLLVAALNPAGALVPLAAMAAAYFAAALAVPRAVAPAPPRAAKLPVRNALPWLACLFALGHLLATVEVAPLPLVQRLGADPALAAVVIVVLSGASIAGSAVFAWRRPPAGRRQAALALAGFVAGGSVLAADLGWAGLLTGAALVGGGTGPLLTIASVRLQRLLPEGRRAEGFSAAFVVQATGFGLGSLSVGVLPLSLAPTLGVVSSACACAMLALLSSS